MMKKNGFSILIVGALVAFALVVGLIFTLKLKQAPGKSSSDQGRNLVAIGASFTKANNLSSKLAGDNPEYSFATGTKIESLYFYLKEKGEDINPRNLAESGANSQKVLSQQVPNAVSFQPKYVLIDIMADIFEEEKPVRFKQNLVEIVRQLKKQDATILIGTYPDIISMRKAGFSSCSEDKLGLGIGKVTEEKLKLFNRAISEVASDNNLILVDNFNTLGSGEVSDYDCLHPNIEGQKKLARAWISALEGR
jgi:lysophospholipase L1-like esterase